MLPTGSLRRVQAGTSMLSNPTAKFDDDLQLRAGPIEELVVDPVGEEGQDPVAALDGGEELVPRRRQLALPDRRVGGLADAREPLFGDDARDEDLGLGHASALRRTLRRRGAGAARTGARVGARARGHERPDARRASVRFSRELAYEIRMWLPPTPAERRAREDADAGLVEQPVGELLARSCRSRRCRGRRRTRPAGGGSRSPGSR